MAEDDAEQLAGLASRQAHGGSGGGEALPAWLAEGDACVAFVAELVEFVAEALVFLEECFAVGAVGSCLLYGVEDFGSVLVGDLS